MKAKSRAQTVEPDDQVITPINSLQILPFGTGTKLIRLDIPVSDEFLQVWTELSEIKQLDLKRYLVEALHDSVDLDLENPTEIGMDVCKNLKEVIHPDEK